MRLKKTPPGPLTGGTWKEVDEQYTDTTTGEVKKKKVFLEGDNPPEDPQLKAAFTKALVKAVHSKMQAKADKAEAEAKAEAKAKTEADAADAAEAADALDKQRRKLRDVKSCTTDHTCVLEKDEDKCRQANKYPCDEVPGCFVDQDSGGYNHCRGKPCKALHAFQCLKKIDLTEDDKKKLRESDAVKGLKKAMGAESEPENKAKIVKQCTPCLSTHDDHGHKTGISMKEWDKLNCDECLDKDEAMGSKEADQWVTFRDYKQKRSEWEAQVTVSATASETSERAECIREFCGDMASADDKQRAWRKCFLQGSRKHHPDKGGDAETISKLNNCNKVMKGTIDNEPENEKQLMIEEDGCKVGTLDETKCPSPMHPCDNDGTCVDKDGNKLKLSDLGGGGDTALAAMHAGDRTPEVVLAEWKRSLDALRAQVVPAAPKEEVKSFLSGTELHWSDLRGGGDVVGGDLLRLSDMVPSEDEAEEESIVMEFDLRSEKPAFW